MGARARKRQCARSSLSANYHATHLIGDPIIDPSGSFDVIEANLEAPHAPSPPL
jgi:hypothetical protein